MPDYSLGVDIGGTFTDIVVYDHANNSQLNRKVLTTHDDPSRAVIEGVAHLLDAFALDPADFSRFVHATTLFTNALVERRGARTGLLTTHGFRDTLEIGRERKYELYDIQIEKPEPLVARDMRLEVRERIKADGSVHTPLDEAGLIAAAKILCDSGVESIAIVFCIPTPIPITNARPWRCWSRCILRSAFVCPATWRRKSANTSAHRRPSPTPM